MDSTPSPGSKTAETCRRGDPLPAKLRFMCFYGGHIIPRPHHKALSYVGGEKRIVAVDRGVSLAELRRHLSHTLLNGHPFTLKYQLPHEDLDSLISIANDEDLENMVQEYDRIALPLRPRLRFFLFPDKPESAASAGCLLADAKSERWFVDAINDSGLVSRAFSDPTIDISTVDLDGISISKVDSCADLAVNVSNQDAQSTPDSVASESSIASPWKHMIYQDATLVTNWETTSRPSAIMDLTTQVLMHHHPVQQASYLLHTTPPTHYIHHPTPEPLPVSYYPIYAPPQQQPLPDQHPPVYVLPVAQAPPPYNFPPAAVQSNIPDAAAAAPPPNMTIIPPICAANATTLYGPPAAAAAAAAPTPTTVVQVPTGNQLQAQQYLGLSQVPPSLQHITAAANSQVYYAAQRPAAVAPIPSQYQTVTPATAVLISQATAAQLPGENSMQQIVTSLPL